MLFASVHQTRTTQAKGLGDPLQYLSGGVHVHVKSVACLALMFYHGRTQCRRQLDKANNIEVWL